MARSAAATRRRILEAAYALFYREGFARVGVDAIAAAAGVTKRTLYYHFDSKDALLGAVLEFHHELALDQIRGWASTAGPAGGDARTAVGAIFAALEAWADTPGWRGSGFSRAAMELAGLPGHPARAAARAHKAAVEDWLAERLAGAGCEDAVVLARQIMLLLEGSLSLMLIHGDGAYARAAAAAADRLLCQATR